MSCNFTNAFGLTEYNGRCQFFEAEKALPEGLGWFIVAGLGAVFAFLTLGIIAFDRKYSGCPDSEKDWAGAGRSIGIGLTACDIVSKWTWAATLLQSSNVAYKFGVSGPFWYAAGATVQVLLFAILAVEVKRKAPQVNTVLQIVRARWGTTAHLVFLFFCLCTNVIVTSMLILGGAAVINALSGVDLYAAAFLIPVGVCFYTAHGGLRATYLAAWTHVAIIYAALCIFMFSIYSSNETLGSPSQVYQNLRVIENKYPVKDNMGGSFVTMFSQSGLIFGIINIIGNFGTVFVDQAYWMGAIAAQPEATYKGYLLGGICWFAIPFTLATSMGLGARALDLPITIDESNAGLVPPAVAVHLLGKGGAFLLILQLFMAVTSTASAEQMAVSSLVTYDVYQTYINKKATAKQLHTVGRIMIAGWAVLSGVLAIILFKLGLNLGWVYLFMGIIIGGAVFPMACCITWKKCSAKAAITGACVSLPLAVMTWLITAAKLNNGVVDLKTTAQDYPMLAGNLVALCVSALIVVVMSLVYPDNFDWKELNQVDNLEVDASTILSEEMKEQLNQVVKWTWKTGGGLTVVLLVLWPLLALPAKVFSEGYFTMWIIIAIIWGLFASVACVCVPVWQGRGTWVNAWQHMVQGRPLEEVIKPPPSPTAMSADPSVAAKVELSMVADKK